MTDSPPNILLIITDQQRADYLGCTGHPLLRTPNLDGLAARGTIAGRCYVASPVCMPNRASLMTGRMPSLHGARSNGVPLNRQANTFVDLLAAHGYQTALMGKSHLQNFTDNPPLQRPPEPGPGKRRAGGDLGEALKPFAPGAEYEYELPSRWRGDAQQPLKTPFYGFQHVRLATGHGDRVGGQYLHWLGAHQADPERLTGPENSLPHDSVCPQAWRTAMPEELYPTAYVADMTCEYLRGHRQPAKPFFAMASFPDPHHPFTPPGRYWDMYDPAAMPLPESFHRDSARPPAMLAWHRAQHLKGAENRGGYAPIEINEREAREAMALTCGMISMIDDAVGRILETLAEQGLADNTVVIFTADHGDYLGHHRLLLKGPMHYQSLVRVPLIWSEPDGIKTAPAAPAFDGLCSTIDIAASILDRAGIAPFNGMQGRSLLPGIAGDDSTAPGEIVIEEDQQRPLMELEQTARVRTLVARDWRLTLYAGAEAGELYNLRDDPDEFDNLWDDAASAPVKADLLERLARRMMDLAERSPLPRGQA